MKNETLIAIRSFVIAAGATAAATFVGVFGVYIGASAAEMGWLQSSSNSLSNSGQLIWGRISDRFGRRAPFIIAGSIASAILWLFMAFVRSPVTLIVAYALLSLFSAMIAVNWYSFIADSISGSSRGHFLSRINNLASIGTIISISVMIFLFSSDVTSDIIIPFGAASGAYVLSAVLALRLKEEKAKSKLTSNFRKTLRSLKNDRPFYKYFVATNVQSLFWSMAWPMFPITIVSVMHFPLRIVATLTVISLVSSIVAQLMMGRVVDKFSRIPLIFANRVMLCLIPVMYALFFSFHEFIIMEVYSGFVGAIQSTVMTSYLMDVVPTEHKGEYMSILNGFNGGVYFAGAIIGGYLLTFFLTVYPLREALFAGYMIVFAGRFASSLLFLRLEEVGDKGGRKSWPLYSILMRMRQPGAPSGGNLRPK